jgi:hypothetical protein
MVEGREVLENMPAYSRVCRVGMLQKTSAATFLAANEELINELGMSCE